MDAQLRQQVAASPDLSLGRDWSEYDVWLRQQFPASPDLSCYPVRLWAQQPAAGGGPATSDAALGAVEAADTLSAAVALAVGVSLGATEAADTAAFGVGLVDALALAGVEASDLFAGEVAVIPAAAVDGGGARPVGGWTDFDELFLRPLKLGRKSIKVSDGRELIDVVAATIVEDVEIEWDNATPVFLESPKVDWSAVARLESQAKRLRQGVVSDAIAAVLEAVKRASSVDDDDEETMMLSSLLH